MPDAGSPNDDTKRPQRLFRRILVWIGVVATVVTLLTGLFQVRRDVVDLLRGSSTPAASNEPSPSPDTDTPGSPGASDHPATIDSSSAKTQPDSDLPTPSLEEGPDAAGGATRAGTDPSVAPSPAAVVPRIESVDIEFGGGKFDGDHSYLMNGASWIEIRYWWTTYTQTGELGGKCQVRATIYRLPGRSIHERQTLTACSLHGFMTPKAIREPGQYLVEVVVQGSNDTSGTGSREITVS